jgi:hypothetical protein
MSITGLGHSDFFILDTGRPSSSKTAQQAQILPQAPHDMHNSSLITCRCFFSPEMAETGHIFRQAPQPLHNSEIV